MQKPDSIDFAKLLGFATVRDEIAGKVDFCDDTFGAKLGAKVGGEESGAPKKQIDLQD